MESEIPTLLRISTGTGLTEVALVVENGQRSAERNAWRQVVGALQRHRETVVVGTGAASASNCV